jgi:shikimate kinase
VFTVTPAAGEDRRVLMLGLMGSGKTSVGRLLAEQLRIPYLDNDALLREATGLSPAAYQEQHGALLLHRREWSVFVRILEQPGSWIASAAASVVDDPRAASLIETHAVHSVWLRARPDTLVRRVAGGSERPLGAPPTTTMFTRMLERRAPGYARLSAVIVDTDARTPQDCARLIMRRLRWARGRRHRRA